MTPQGWEEKTLGEITISVCNGTSAPQCKKVTNYPVTRIETIATSKINLDKVGYIDSCSEDFINKYKMEYGDILFSNINSDIHLGKTAIYEIPKGILLHGMNLLNIRVNKKLINPFYLNYYFIYLRFLGSFIRMASRSVNQSSINQTKLKALKISYPSLPEQERIVAKLDKAFEAIDKVKANAEQNLNNAKELFETALNKAFTENKENWEEKKLSEVCEKITDGSHFSPQSNSNEKFPYITVKDIDKNDKINFDNCKFINQEDYDTLCHSGCRPVCGDILFSKDGTVGKVSLVDYDKQFVVLSSLAIITPMQKLIQPKFLMYILKTPRFLAEAIGRKTGVAIRRIILKNLKTISLHFPKNIAEQQKIVEKFDALQEQTKRLEAIYTQKIKECDELKQSILQKAFRGEL